MKTLCLMLLGFTISYTSLAQFESYAALANRAQDKMYTSFRSTSGSYYIENNGTSNTYFHYWWNAHALDVLVDAYLRTNDSKYVTRMNTLVNNWSYNNGGSIYNDYYDDMEWFALALFRAYDATGNSNFLTLSTNLWGDIKTGENGNQGGGIAWRKTQLDYKNTPANAPAIIYACRRHQKWGHTWELDLATDLYDWLKGALRESSGRINDGINRTGNGEIDYWQLTYNYGVYIGAALEMYQSTNNVAYLNDAILTADFAVQSTELSTNGIFKDEGSGDGALFKGILARYLALLSQEPAVPVSKRNTYEAVLEDQALSIHQDGFSRAYDIIGTDWAIMAGSSGPLSADLSGIMMLEVAAGLGFNAPTPPVVIYENCSYTGTSTSIGVGSYTMGQLQTLGIDNDSISSIKVQSGYQATLYEHHNFTGMSIVKSGDDSCLDDDEFNDEMSSLVISQLAGVRVGSENILEEALAVEDKATFYPNPVNRGDILKVYFGNRVNQMEVSLVDLLGRELFYEKISGVNKVVSFPTKGIMSGTYVLRLIEKGGKVTISRLVVI